ncbi:MAG: Tn3 family transposase [Ardenticatenaceae bacterium]|nr:Tn3 family transposase [Ardenticatenaceae bacterium]
MKTQWNIDELEAQFTLLPPEIEWLDVKAKAYNRLGQAMMLKYFQQEGRFPEESRNVPATILDFIAQQLEIDPAAINEYKWDGRTARDYKRAIREMYGFRANSVTDQDELRDWLIAEALPDEHRHEHLAQLAYARLRQLHIEPPKQGRMDRLVASARHRYDQQFFEKTARRLPELVKTRLKTLIHTEDTVIDDTEVDSEDDPELLRINDLKSGSGAAKINNIKQVGARLAYLQAIGLPDDLFAGVPWRYLQQFAQQTAVESVSHLQRHESEAQTLTLLAAFCWVRQRKITDQLVELFIQVLNDIRLRAKQRVERELLTDFIRVNGKQQLLFKLAEAMWDNPDGIIRDVLYPIIGKKRLKQLVKEAQKTGPYRRSVQTRISGSWTHHYRPLLPLMLNVLHFRSNNTRHQPLIKALDVIAAYLEESDPFFPKEQDVPLDDVIQKQWQGWIYQKDSKGRRRIRRVRYELCVLQSLREKLRCREIWVAGSNRYRNPDEDVPADFVEKRESYYQALSLPTNADDFVTAVQQQLRESLQMFNDSIPNNPDVEILSKSGGWIRLTPLQKQRDPSNLRKLKNQVKRRWWMTNLLDILKEVDLRVNFTANFPSLTGQERLSPEEKQKRLLLCLFGLGTNTGLTSVSMGDHGASYANLQYVRRRFIAKAALRQSISDVVNRTLAVRQPQIWGDGTTWCASDSKQFVAWNQNLLTQWHRRYHKAGVMVYWHVAKQSLCIYSQLKAPSSSEVAAMIEGVLRHGTEQKVDRNFVDTHGQSEVGFAFCHLLGFQLMPRFKNIHAQKLALVDKADAASYPHLKWILEQAIDWELIRKQYDEMVKYATALRLGTAEAESILKRFTRANNQHPTYKALAELGRALKTIFLCSYLTHKSVRREIQEGLNVVENWNSANGFIFYGKRGEVSTNDPDAQEIAILSLHLLQSCVVYINTLMAQEILAEPEWQKRMTVAGWRALTPLFYGHVNPYGRFDLDMNSRLPLQEPDEM